MEVTVYEDPACSWCWAFEPVATAFAFELGHVFTVRHVMGGLRDRPPADVDFVVGQWRKAQSVSSMPFDVALWEKHTLQTTFLACRSVKAAAILGDGAASRLLRRLREAFYTERVAIDDANEVLRLAEDVGLDKELLLENLTNGRAAMLFERDRDEAAGQGFGFPTLLLRGQQQAEPVLLQGAVPYEDLLAAATALGVATRLRRQFQDNRADWARLFKIHPRLSAAELEAVTRLRPEALDRRVLAGELFRDGVFYTQAPPSAARAAAGEAVVVEAAAGEGGRAEAPAASFPEQP